MKTIKSFFAALALLISITNVLHAGNTGVNVKSVTSQIKAALSLPNEFIKQGLHQKITFYFSVNETGCVTEVIASAPDKNLKESLETQFKKLKLTGFKPSAINSVEVNFIVY